MLGPRSTPIVTVTVAAAVVLAAGARLTCFHRQGFSPCPFVPLSESRHDSDTHNYPVRRPVIRGAGLLRCRYRAASAWTSESAAVSASASAVTAYISQRMPSASSAQNLSALA